MFQFHRPWAWLPLAWCAACAAAPDKPWQLCRSGLTQAHRIETNYRYPPVPAQRTVVDPNRYECTSAQPWRDCYGEILACGVGEHIEKDQCGETAEWWYDVSAGGHFHLDENKAPHYVPWSFNPAVLEAVRYAHAYQVDVYRTWPFLSKNTPQFLRRESGWVWRSEGLPGCYTMAYLVGFFNGVWNTRREAFESLKEIEKGDFLGSTWRDAPVRYELFYNQSCKRGEGDVCLQDVAEVFRQRSREIDGLLSRRWEYFWEQVTGRHDQPGSFTDRLASSGPAIASWFDALANATLATITALSTSLADDPPTAQDTASHTAQLIRAGQRAERAVLVAHSQGNLFANAAYDAYLAHSRQAGRAAGEDTGYVAAQVVHIAPASPTLRGPYVLADSDLVINGLRRVDGTYLPASNVTLGIDGRDSSGHKLLDTYLDASRPVRDQIRQLIAQALDAL